MKRELLVTVLLCTGLRLLAVDALTDPVFSTGTNSAASTDGATVPLRPLRTLLYAGFSASSWSFDGFSATAPAESTDPSDIFRNFNAGAEFLFVQQFGAAVDFRLQDGGGFSGTISAVWRHPVGSSGLYSDMRGIAAGLGVSLVSSPGVSDKPVLLPSVRFRIGSDFGQMLRLEMDGAGFVPWSPGWLIGKNNRFFTEAQLRIGSVGLWAVAERITRRIAGSDPDADVDFLNFKAGFVFFKKERYRLVFYGGMERRLERYYIVNSSGPHSRDRQQRAVSLVGVRFDGSYRNARAEVFEYAFGLEAAVYQQLRNLEWDILIWESRTPELSFYWQIRFGS